MDWDWSFARGFWTVFLSSHFCINIKLHVTHSVTTSAHTHTHTRTHSIYRIGRINTLVNQPHDRWLTVPLPPAHGAHFLHESSASLPPWIRAVTCVCWLIFLIMCLPTPCICVLSHCWLLYVYFRCSIYMLVDLQHISQLSAPSPEATSMSTWTWIYNCHHSYYPLDNQGPAITLIIPLLSSSRRGRCQSASVESSKQAAYCCRQHASRRETRRHDSRYDKWATIWPRNFCGTVFSTN
jgi:hypothetical protein